jgi:hypothetical protein
MKRDTRKNKSLQDPTSRSKKKTTRKQNTSSTVDTVFHSREDDIQVIANSQTHHQNNSSFGQAYDSNDNENLIETDAV